jgi:ketosteroid isomerase-like protein
LLWVPSASGQSAEENDVIETFNTWIAARNAADVASLANTWVSPASYFAGGSLLLEFEFTTDQLAGMIQGQFDGGRKDNLLAHHVVVRIFGEAALLTCYLSGTHVVDERTTIEGTQSFTSIWVKIGGQWKLTHFHQSPIAGGPPSVLMGEAND